MARAIKSKIVIVYKNGAGKEPFTIWLNGLKDGKGRRRILSRLRRLEQGNYGDCKHIKDGIFELRLFFGAGYRIYFGEDRGNIVLLLCGGTKSTQGRDIGAALTYWQEYSQHDSI